MTTDQPLTELVRTIAEAVEELSKLVEGMPARVEARLAVFRQDLNGVTQTLTNQMEALRAEAADMRGSLSSMIGSVRTEMEDAGNALRSIIGDNRTALDGRVAELADDVKVFNDAVADIRTSLDSITKRSEEAVTGLRTEFTEANAALQSRLELTDKAVKDARAACDPTDLYSGIATLTRKVEEANAATETVAGSVTKLNDTVTYNRREATDKIDTASAQWAESRTLIVNRVSALAQKVDEFPAQITDLEKNIAAVSTDLEAANVRAAQSTELVNAGLAELSEHLVEVQTNAGARAHDLDERITNMGQEINSQNKSIDNMGSAFEAANAKLAENISVVSGAVDKLHEDLMQADANIVARVDDVSLGVTNLVKRVDDVSNDVNSIANLNTQLATRVEAGLQGLETEIDVMSKNDDEVHAAVVASIAEVATKNGNKIAEAVQRIDEVAGTIKRLDESLGATDTKLNGAITTAWERHQDLLSTVTNLSVRMSTTDEMLEQQVAGAVALRGTLDETSQEVTTMRGSIDSLRVIAEATRSGLDDNDKTVLQLVEDLASTRTLTEMVNARINQLRDETTTSLNGITEELATRASTEDVQKAVHRATEEIEAISTRFHSDLAALETTLRNALDKRAEVLEAADVAVGERVTQLAATVPAPLDTDALREDVLARVASLVPAMEIPQLDFDVAVGDNDQSLMFTFSNGQREIKQVVPLELGFKYRGVYKADEDYAKGNFVTHKGSMWYAKTAPTGEPGKDLAGWQLAVKCGRDGKDASPARIKHVRDPETGLIQESRISHDNPSTNEE